MRRAAFLSAMLAILACTGCFWRRHKQPEPQPVYSDIDRPDVTNAPPVTNTPAASPQQDSAPIKKAPAKKASVMTSTGATNAPANTNIFNITPDQGPNGRVSSVNANLGYVVLSFPLGQVPPVSKQLVVYRNGNKVGEVKITEMQRDDNTVADIVEGDAQVGDEVREK
jgi:hypothetical protein